MMLPGFSLSRSILGHSILSTLSIPSLPSSLSILLGAALLVFSPVFAQVPDTAAARGARSPVLKGDGPEPSPFRVKINRSTEELFNAFMIVTEANSGDPVAQSELGLRYLLGRDFRPDTAKAALWIGRSAAQDYLPARYNRGVLRNNGWGMAWDPFGAYSDAKYTAEKGMVEGLFMYGLMYTDNLVVARDYAAAYRWIRTAADSGYQAAKEVLEEFEKAGIMDKLRADSAAGKSVAKAGGSSGGGASGAGTANVLTPVFLDLSTDTLADPDNAMLVQDALGRPDDSLARPSDDPEPALDEIVTDSLFRAARNGSPEAMSLIGRMYQVGEGLPENAVEASAYYLRAMRNEGRWAPVLLWKMAKGEEYYSHLRERIDGGDMLAAFVWSSLILVGFDHSLTDEQAIEYLEKGAKEGLPDAQIGLAMRLYGVGQARRADSLLSVAAAAGTREAEVRLVMSELRRAADSPGEDPARSTREREIIRTASGWAASGSLLAQVVLGYGFEKGMGVEQDIPSAVALYRRAASRGSRIAYDALRNLYDERRPAEEEFVIQE